MRHTSVSLPAKQAASDPYEKPDRYETSLKGPCMYEKVKADWMAQSQRQRWIKTGSIIALVVFLFYYLSPKGVDIYNGGERRLPNSSPAEHAMR